MNWILSMWRVLAMSEVLGPLLKRALALLGFTVLSFTGSYALIQVVMSHVISSYGGLPSSAITYLSIAKIDQAISIVMSAWVSRLTMKGLTAAGTFKQVLWRPGQQGSLL